MAGRIPQSFISDLVGRTDIVALIEQRIPLKKAGREYHACCPFHTEKTPSFTVSPGKQFYHCFGCGAHGTAISFLMDYEHLSFVEAVEELARGAGVTVPYEGGVPEKKVDLSSDYDLLEQVNRFYQRQLRQHPEKDAAIAYLKKRGISGETAARFEIGLASSGWRDLGQALGQPGRTREGLMTLGLIKPGKDGDPYDLFRHRIMFPIRDHRGRMIGFGGRMLGDEPPKYLNSPESAVFKKGSELYGLWQVRQQRDLTRVLVVEGYMDVISLAEHGVNNAVAALGTAFTPQHMSLLLRQTRDIVFCFDGDRAGRQAAWRAVEAALPAYRDGTTLRFAFLPEGEDPDTYIQRYGKDAFDAMIDGAQLLSEFVLRHLAEQSPPTSLEGKSRLVALARPLIQAMTAESTLRKLLVQRLCAITGTTAADLGEATSSAPSQPRVAPAGKRGKAPTPTRTAITLLLHHPELITEVSNISALNSVNIPGVQLLLELVGFIAGQPHITTAAILEHWRDSDAGAQLAALARQDLGLSEEQLKTEFLGALDRLQKQQREGELEALLNKSRYDGLSDKEKEQLRHLLTLNAQ